MIIIFSGKVKSQELINYNLYIQNPYLYNPAYTIDQQLISAYLNSHLQWMGFEGAPRTYTFGIHAPFTKNMGLGLSVYNSSQGLINNFNARLSYAFRGMLADDHYFQLGTSMGISNDRLDVLSANYVDVTDPNLSTDYYNNTSFAAGVGLLYYIKGFEVQAIMPQLYERNHTSFYTIGVLGYNIKPANASWSLKPSVMARGSDISPLQFDGNLMGTWKEMVWAQVGYRTNKSVIASLGVNIKGLGIGYAYQINTDPIAAASNGTHEIQLIVNFGKDLYDSKPKKTEQTGFVKTSHEKENIANANIIVTEDGKEVANTKTDADGYYTLKLKPGKTYEVNVTAENYQPLKEILTTNADSYKATKDFLLIPEKSKVTGYVTNIEDNQPVEAQIKILDGSEEITTTTSNSENGEYKAELKPNKTYTFKVTAKGYKDKTEKLVINTEKNTNLDIKLNPESKVVKTTGTITDKDGTKLPTEIKIYKDGKLIKTINSEDGSYQVDLEKGSKYKLVFNSPNYDTKTIYIDLTDEEQNTKTQNVTLDEKPKDLKITGDINFETGTFKFTDESYKTLQEVIDYMNEYKNVKIHIGGHTDSDGSSTYNQWLSEKRAKVCYDYIIIKKIDAKRLSYKGYGESTPLVPNTTPANKKKNRRVEFRTIE